MGSEKQNSDDVFETRRVLNRGSVATINRRNSEAEKNVALTDGGGDFTMGGIRNGRVREQGKRNSVTEIL